MVLVKAGIDLTAPYGATAELVKVPALRHEYVTRPKAAADCDGTRHSDLGHVVQVEPVLLERSATRR